MPSPQQAVTHSMRGTTILALQHRGRTIMAGDGQVTMGETIMKSRARKVRKLHHDSILAGFAGTTADAMTLFERLEAKLEQYNGNLTRAVVELAKDWRTDKTLRRLEALLLAADTQKSFLISGAGDVIEPDQGVVAIGSGGGLALAAAMVLMQHTDLDARKIAEAALQTAAAICVYTNTELSIEEL